MVRVLWTLSCPLEVKYWLLIMRMSHQLTIKKIKSQGPKCFISDSHSFWQISGTAQLQILVICVKDLRWWKCLNLSQPKYSFRRSTFQQKIDELLLKVVLILKLYSLKLFFNIGKSMPIVVINKRFSNFFNVSLTSRSNEKILHVLVTDNHN